MGIKLYQTPGCFYCAKVRKKLEELGLEYESIQVSPTREEVRKISGQTQVPVLVDEEHGVEGM
ncbi:MAG: glutaredoxin, partial [Halobacteria archaeon]|nr:glutaredoxin [Halobacteria archaeon]